MIYTFTKPVTFEDKEYKEIQIDIENLTGKDFQQAKQTFQQKGMYTPVPQMDSEYLIILIQKHTKLPFEFFESLPIAEYIKLTGAISSFLSN